MDGDIELVNKIDKSIGEKAFVINVAAKVLSEEVYKMNDELQLDGIALKPIDVNRSKILIFEDQVFSQITLENILFDELKLRNQTSFFNSGSSIAKAISSFFHETE
jgi:translation elongation factor EF-G